MVFKWILITLFCLSGLNADVSLTRPEVSEGLGPVINLGVLGNTVSWSTPANFQSDRLSYLVEILDGDKVISSLQTQSLSANVYADLVPCYEYTVRVTSEYETVSGEAVEYPFVAPAEAHMPPTLVEAVPSLVSATITLQGNAVKLNRCPINEVMVLCYDASTSQFFNVTALVEDNESRSFEIIIPDLTFNTHYSCNAQLMPQTSLFSDSFQFDTLAIPDTDLDVSDVSANAFTISWEEPEKLSRYISLHTLAITSVGPKHFVRESCNVERNVTYYVEVPANVQTYTFSDALPNYEYQISAVTKYSIGVNSVGDATTVNTEPALPGRITDMRGRLSQPSQCQRYSAYSNISWSSPCDINGELDRYEVTITSMYNIGDEALQHVRHLTFLPSDAGEDSLFQFQLQLFPFFRYSVLLELYAAYPSEQRPLLPSIVPHGAFHSCNF